MTAQAHAAAVLGLLSGITAHDGAVPPSPSYPYAVVYLNAGTAHEVDLTFDSDEQVYDVQVTSVGATAAAARITADRVRAALLDQTPTVTGRTCWPIRLEASQTAREDRDITVPTTGTHPHYAVDVYRLASRPA